MDIYDESGLPILDEAGAEPIEAELDDAAGQHRHRYALQQLIPLELGENHTADMVLEGDHLDEAELNAAELLEEMFPDTSFRLLANWERLLGLPDPCAGTPATVAQRIAAVTAKWGERRRLSAPYLIEVAANLGYTVTITNYSTRRFGRDVMGTAYCGKEWANTITVHAPGVPVAEQVYLECAFARLRAAHIYVDWDFS